MKHDVKFLDLNDAKSAEIGKKHKKLISTIQKSFICVDLALTQIICGANVMQNSFGNSPNSILNYKKCLHLHF